MCSLCLWPTPWIPYGPLICTPINPYTWPTFTMPAASTTQPGTCQELSTNTPFFPCFTPYTPPYFLCVHTPFPYSPYFPTSTIHLYSISQPLAIRYHIPESNSRLHNDTPIIPISSLGNAYVPATFPFSRSPGNQDPITRFVGFLL